MAQSQAAPATLGGALQPLTLDVTIGYELAKGNLVSCPAMAVDPTFLAQITPVPAARRRRARGAGAGDDREVGAARRDAVPRRRARRRDVHRPRRQGRAVRQGQGRPEDRAAHRRGRRVLRRAVAARRRLAHRDRPGLRGGDALRARPRGPPAAVPQAPRRRARHARRDGPDDAQGELAAPGARVAQRQRAGRGASAANIVLRVADWVANFSGSITFLVLHVVLLRGVDRLQLDAVRRSIRSRTIC